VVSYVYNSALILNQYMSIILTLSSWLVVYILMVSYVHNNDTNIANHLDIPN